MLLTPLLEQEKCQIVTLEGPFCCSVGTICPSSASYPDGQDRTIFLWLLRERCGHGTFLNQWSPLYGSTSDVQILISHSHLMPVISQVGYFASLWIPNDKKQRPPIGLRYQEQQIDFYYSRYLKLWSI